MFLCVSVFNALVDLSRTPLFGGEEWGGVPAFYRCISNVEKRIAHVCKVVWEPFLRNNGSM